MSNNIHRQPSNEHCVTQRTYGCSDGCCLAQRPQFSGPEKPQWREVTICGPRGHPSAPRCSPGEAPKSVETNSYYCGKK